MYILCITYYVLCIMYYVLCIMYYVYSTKAIYCTSYCIKELENGIFSRVPILRYSNTRGCLGEREIAWKYSGSCSHGQFPVLPKFVFLLLYGNTKNVFYFLIWTFIHKVLLWMFGFEKLNRYVELGFSIHAEATGVQLGILQCRSYEEMMLQHKNLNWFLVID